MAKRPRVTPRCTPPDVMNEQGATPLSGDRLVDAACDRFEAAWIAGGAPRIEEHLAAAKTNAEVDPLLLRELLAVELYYRQQACDGPPVSDERILADHPELAPALGEALASLRREEASLARYPIGRSGVGPALSGGETAPHHAAEGLKVRCPHCSHGVELASDDVQEPITCGSCGESFRLAGSEADSDAPPQKRLGRFEILGPLGVGGFGAVWKAHDGELDRVVALKTPRARLNGRELELFYREARAAAQLRHPHIVPVHEVGSDAGTLFIVSEFIDGRTISDWLKERVPTHREAAELVATIAGALHYAHERGVIHRDLKPSNLMRDRGGRPYVMDFGLAKRETGEVTMTVAGQVLGTPAYMSPEQACGQGHWTDRRADVYSLGVIVFEMLTGELPFRGNVQEQLRQKLTRDAPDPRTLCRSVPADLATLCLKCLEIDPNRRYPTAAALEDELRRFLAGRPIKARPVPASTRVWRWALRNKALAAAAGLVVFLAIAGPVVAITIEAQRRELVARDVEKTRILGERRNALDDAVAENTRLREELNAFASRNPLPSEIGADWRVKVLRRGAEAAATSTSPSNDAVDALRRIVSLANFYLMNGDRERAVSAFERAIALLSSSDDPYPRSARGQAALAHCYILLGDLENAVRPGRARELWRRASELNSERNGAAPIALHARRLQLLFRSPPENATEAREWAALNREIEALIAQDPGGFYDLCQTLGVALPALPLGTEPRTDSGVREERRRPGLPD